MDNLQVFTKDKTFTGKITKADKIENICGVECYEENGTAYLKLESVARGLGFTQTQIKNGVEYTSIRWETIFRYLEDIGFPNKLGKDSFIPENTFYRLAMKAKNETAEKFQALVADEIIPIIRKTGGYVNSDELFINTYLPFADENTKTMFCQTLKTVREQNEIIQKQQKEIMHKEDVIIGLVEDIDLATKRQRITQIVRHCEKKNYQERYRLLYDEFSRKYHCDLKYRMENDILKPKAKNTMDYIDRRMNMIPQLYEIACKLFENDVEALKAEWESVIS